MENFGEAYALTDQLAVSLQFSRVIPTEKRKAARTLASNAAKTVKDYVETFRGNLPSSVLSSMKYSFNVYLVPKVASRKSAADAAVDFVRVNEASPEELSRLQKLNVLIKEKRIPIANLDLFKPGQAVAKINERCPHRVSINAHADAWRHFNVRPPRGDPHPERCITEYCVYDEPHNDYLYTNAWVEKCINAFGSVEQFKAITGREPEAQ